MKGTIIAAAAALAGGASAHGHAHARAHQMFQRDNDTAACIPVCTTYYKTVTGEATWVPVVPPPVTKVAPPPPPPAATTPPCVPTADVTICETPGVYTVPANTIVIKETKVTCGASETTMPAGTQTYGGSTTVVDKSTIITCPYPTVSTQPGGYPTTVLTSTVVTCPSAGTCTLVPATTTVVAKPTVCVVPAVTTFAPGTYTHAAVIKTVNEASAVIVCPYTVVAAPTPAAPKPQPEAPKPQPEAPKPKVQVAKESYAPAQPSSAPKPATIVGNGKRWATTYSPYDATTGGCLSAEAVAADIAGIAQAGFGSIRVYSTDCNTLANVGPPAAKYGLKLIVGVFVSQPGCHNANPDVASQISELKKWMANGNAGNVEMMIVGNEAGSGGICTPGQLKALIVEVKTMMTSVGCNAPVTTTDTTATWQNPEWTQTICEVIDVVGLNSHAYFNAQTDSGSAGPFVKGQVDIVGALCQKKVYVTETGWPTEGPSNGNAHCSPEDQVKAISSIFEHVGDISAIFSWGTKLQKWKGSPLESSFVIGNTLTVLGI